MDPTRYVLSHLSITSFKSVRSKVELKFGQRQKSKLLAVVGANGAGVQCCVLIKAALASHQCHSNALLATCCIGSGMQNDSFFSFCCS